MSVEYETYFIYGWEFNDSEIEDAFSEVNFEKEHLDLESYLDQFWSRKKEICLYDYYMEKVVIGFEIQCNLHLEDFISQECFNTEEVKTFYKKVTRKNPQEAPKIFRVERVSF